MTHIYMGLPNGTIQLFEPLPPLPAARDDADWVLVEHSSRKEKDMTDLKIEVGKCYKCVDGAPAVVVGKLPSGRFIGYRTRKETVLSWSARGTSATLEFDLISEWKEPQEPKEETLLFSVTAPNGPVYEVFTNGSIKGFPDGCVVRNWFPARAHEQAAKIVEPKEPRKGEVWIAVRHGAFDTLEVLASRERPVFAGDAIAIAGPFPWTEGEGI